MLAKVFSAAVVGLEGVVVEVETDISNQGLPSFTIVGLPDKAVEEAKERVRSALKNSGCDFPQRRITVNLDIPAVKVEKLTDGGKNSITKGESSKQIRQRAQKARDIQTKRFKNLKITSNSEMKNKDIKKYCPLSDDCFSLLKLAVLKMQLSARSYQRTIKIARTIADLENSKDIKTNHIAESLQYRPKTDISLY